MVSDRVTTLDFFIPVQDSLPLVEARMRIQGEGHHPDLDAALQHLLSAGGKRVRPTVSLLVGGMLGADKDRTIILAAAVEMLHTATLVHDDMIDGALLRRGTPTLNSKWSPAATILTGDFIFARAAKLAAETGSIEVMDLFAKTLSTIVNGEITQMFSSKGVASRENYFDRIYAKTASMFELAAAAPVFLGDIDGKVAEKLQKYGYEIGMAFQIMDDILDFTSESNEIGKPVASDLRSGLITLPALCYLEMVPENPDFKAAMNGGASDETRISRLVNDIRESGAIERSLEEAKEFVNRGLAAIRGLPGGTEIQALEDLARYVVDRPL